MKSNLLLLCLIAFFVQSCSSTHGAAQNSSSNQAKRRQLPETVYLIDKENSGNYQPIELAEENRPQPIQGKKQWMSDFFGGIKYPAIARENGIGGVVILNIEVDARGKVTAVSIKQGVSIECDNEARRAYINSTQEGYIPLKIDGMPVRFRMELPFGFWLE